MLTEISRAEMAELDALADTSRQQSAAHLPFRPDRHNWTPLQLFAITLGMREPHGNEVKLLKSSQ
jgi:hypothetical protein